MAIFQRKQISTVVERLNEPVRWLIFIGGPRQCGKTTLIRQALEQIGQTKRYRYLPVDKPEPRVTPSVGEWKVQGFLNDAIDKPESRMTPSGPDPWTSSDWQERWSALETEERDGRWLVGAWELARLEAAHSERGFVLVFDEIQKIPNWSEVVKGLWDADRWEDRSLHVVLLGSAPLLMQRGLTESLAGRFDPIHLPHWGYDEMAAAFDFDLPHYIYFGGYPGAAPLVPEQTRWRNHIRAVLVEPNVERDILALERVDKPALLKRLLDLSAEFSGEILAYTKMLGQLADAGNTTTLARYLTLLEQVGLVAGLPNYEGLHRRRRASSPKLNVLNTALMSAFSGYSFAEAQADRTFWGRLVESAIGAHLLNTKTTDMRLHYWRRNGNEVDFVLQQGRKLAAFEVKSGRLRSRPKGLEEFREQFKPVNTFLVGEDGISIGEFLSLPAEHWFAAS